MTITIGTPALAVAATGAKNQFLYLQDTRDVLYEIALSEADEKKIVEAKSGSPIAVADNTLNQLTYDGKSWITGSLTSYKFTVLPESKLGAQMRNGKPRVYAQVKDDEIHEYKCTGDDNSWSEGFNFGQALWGTGIAASADILLYQLTTGEVVDKRYQDGTDDWVDGVYEYKGAVTSTPIAALSFGDGSHRVFLLTPQNTFIESKWEKGSKEWTHGPLPTTVKANAGSKLACFGLRIQPRSINPSIWLYFQENGNQGSISSLTTTDDENWELNESVVPPSGGKKRS
ncbi:fucose-specific lectin [Hypomontagnella monticulosa]|nr:fucose-specific lectin [Hypomontagnella monticulosa]